MKKLSNTVKLAVLLLMVPIGVGVWIVLGPDGLRLIGGIHINNHGTSVSFIAYSIMFFCLIGMSYYDEVITPRRELRRKLRKDREDQEFRDKQEAQEKLDKQRKPVEYVYGPDNSGAVGSSNYDMAVIERYNRGVSGRSRKSKKSTPEG